MLSVCVCGGGMGEGKGEPSFAKKLQCSQQPWVYFALVFKKKKILFPSLCLLPAQLVIDPDSLHM